MNNNRICGEYILCILIIMSINMNNGKSRSKSNKNIINRKSKAKKLVCGGNQYNQKDLKIDPGNTLIIIDWDDTLYPTSWSVDNSIDLTDPKSRYKYIKHFELLDDYLSATLEHMSCLEII